LRITQAPFAYSAGGNKCLWNGQYSKHNFFQTTLALQDRIATGQELKSIPKAANLSWPADSNCNFTQQADLPSADPLLGALQDNGGFTFTLSLLAVSPAIDTGGCVGLSFNRPKGEAKG